MSRIDIDSGDNLDLVYTIKDTNGSVVDLTGGSISWTAVISGTSTAVITKAGVLTDPSNGITTVSLDPADTSSIKGTYLLDGNFTDSGANVYSYEDGHLVIS